MMVQNNIIIILHEIEYIIKISHIVHRFPSRRGHKIFDQLPYILSLTMMWIAIDITNEMLKLVPIVTTHANTTFSLEKVDI